MFKKSVYLLFVLIISLALISSTKASGKSLSGKILLQVESNGEAWYVNPVDERRYFMGKSEDAFRVMRELGIGISNSNIEKIKVGLGEVSGVDSDSDGLSDAMEAALGLDRVKADTDGDGYSDYDELIKGFNPLGGGNQVIDNNFSKAQAGKILLQVERNGEAWYVNPSDNKRYFLGLPNDAYKVMEKFGLGITNQDLNAIGMSDEFALDKNVEVSSELAKDNEMEVVKKKIIDYVNRTSMPSGKTATIEYADEDYGLYQFIINVGTGQKLKSYSTKDGVLLFPRAINLDDALKVKEKDEEKAPVISPSSPALSAFPKVELFVMSHCPYGTQMEKVMLPVVNLLGNKIDFKVKFVDYAMHGEKEVTEQLLEYCIQKEQNDKYLAYLGCFLKTGDESDACLVEAKVDTVLLNKCTVATDSEYGISSDLTDKSSWKSGRFPLFSIYSQECLDYGVTGSPALVINGEKVSVTRSSNALLEAICNSFTEKPAECSTDISDVSASPGFGFGAANSSPAEASCTN